jgi:hypothetical protein
MHINVKNHSKFPIQTSTNMRLIQRLIATAFFCCFTLLVIRVWDYEAHYKNQMTAFFPDDSGLKKRHFESQEVKFDSLLPKGGNSVKVLEGLNIADVELSNVKENVVKADNMKVVVNAHDGKVDIKADDVSLRNHPCRLDLDVQKLCYDKDGQVKKSPEVLKPQCDIGELAKDCELLKKLHGYNKTVDKEETEFPLAFGE